MKSLALFIGLLASATCGEYAQTSPAISSIDRTRIAEVYRIGEKIGDSLWPDWHTAPFGMLFIDDEHEFLIRYSKPPDDFRSLGYDKLLKSEVFVRARTFDKSFLATFPPFGGDPVIVIGRAENTAENTSTRWLFVALHEHFHQLQYSRPDYYNGINALELSRGDHSGMWQLNYAFPYKEPDVAQAFHDLAQKLLTAYRARGFESRTKLREFLEARLGFAAMLTPEDYRYLSFQLWQEGIARYTQHRMAGLAATKISPSKSFRKLSDFTSFRSEADRLLKRSLDQLASIDMATDERTVFYPFGGVEGLLLDKVNPNWRGNYFRDKFMLERYYPNLK